MRNLKVNDLEIFRRETRAWLEKNCPPVMRTFPGPDEEVGGGRNPEFFHPDAKIWLERMGEKGWTAPMWPKEYGGGGLTKQEAHILSQEMKSLKCRLPLHSFGIWMLGPALLEFANEAQKKEHLPKIVRGEIRWCQGYSEPGAGSDLAGLQTSAEDKGDHYLVNGSKIWTSYANKADWIFCLVRTDKATKHNGISFLLFDMASEGVTTKPIRLISGSSPFCETFFDNVKVPKENLVGELNKGWTIAKALLQYEREMISGFGLGDSGMSGVGNLSFSQIAKDNFGELDEKISDAAVRQKLAHHEAKGEAFALTLARSNAESKAGQSTGAASSMFKYYGTEHNKNRYELLVELMGEQALGWEGEGFSEQELDVPRNWLRSKGNSIEGGTSEVQLNVIAKRVLGLPD